MPVDPEKTTEVVQANIKNQLSMAMKFAAEINMQMFVAAAVIIAVSGGLLIAHYGNGFLMGFAILTAILSIIVGLMMLEKENVRFQKQYELQTAFIEKLFKAILKSASEEEIDAMFPAVPPDELTPSPETQKLKNARFYLLGLSIVLLGINPFFSNANTNNSSPIQPPPMVLAITPTTVVSETPTTTDQQPTPTADDPQPTPTVTVAIPTPTAVSKVETTQTKGESTPTKAVGK
jgi:hypothetical protein